MKAYELSKTQMSSLYGETVNPKYVYIVNAWEDITEWEVYELGFSSTRKLVRFMELMSPKATVTRRTMTTYGNDYHVHHFSIKELHSDGTEFEFDISKVFIDFFNP